jgi:hypothetical protein
MGFRRVFSSPSFKGRTLSGLVKYYPLPSGYD